MANIDLFVCITKDVIDYAELTKKISSKLISNKHKINWKCILSGKTEVYPEGYHLVSKTKINKKYSQSYNHSVALNKIVEKAKENFVIIMDADFVFLIKDWDDIIVTVLDSGYAAFGVDSSLEFNKTRNFPLTTCFCYRRDLLKGLDLNFNPPSKKSLNLRAVKNKYEEKIIGMPIGSKVRWEASSFIPFLFYDNGLKAKSVKCVLGDYSEAKLPFIDEKRKNKYLGILKKSKLSREHMQEWHYEGELFGTHFRGSRNIGVKDHLVKYWVERIDEYLEKKYGINSI